MKTASCTGLKFLTRIGKKQSASVKQLVERMGQHIKQSEKELAEKEAQKQELLEKINTTSKNSSSPPSLDPLSTEKRQQKNKSGKLCFQKLLLVLMIPSC
ncbi:MAG: hypothetical protein ACRDEA_22910 [Microcystaceae cyanobacterium]